MNEIVFLGIFDKIANWIMGGITKALTWLFTNVIAPVFSAVWNSFMKYVVDMIREFLALLLYKLYALLLSVVYAIEQMVYSFSGVRTVNLDNKSGNILTILMDQPAVNKAFWYITALGIVLCFVFTIIAVMRSTFDFSFDSRKSIGRVLTQFFSAAIAFLTMPALCYGLLELTTICMNAMYMATSASGANSSVTDSLFMLSVKSAIVEQNKPAAAVALGRKISDNPMFWSNFDNIKNFLKGQGVVLNARDVDLFLGFIGCLVLSWNLISLAAVFIKRVMELIVLYIVSPFFVATMPLDDGERFTKWRSTFIGRLCMGAGMIITLNIMMMVLGVVISSDTSASISFVDIRDANSNVLGHISDVALDTLVKLIFMVGCIASVRSIGVALTGIMDQDAASAMNEALDTNKRIYGDIRNASNWIGSKYNKLQEYKQKRKEEDLARRGKAAGLEGEAATEEELAFHNRLAGKNLANKGRALSLQKGDAKAAYNKAAKEGRHALKEFRKLKTNEERQKFMDDFYKNNGMKSLDVDLKNARVGQLDNSEERSASMNLDRKIQAARINRNKFSKGSEQWNKYNNELKELKDTKNKFDSLNTHAERDAFMKLNKDKFSKQEAKSKGEQKAIDNLNKRAENAKAIRDSLTEGTDAWNKANKRYNDILEKSASIEAAGTHSERNEYIAAAGGADDTGDMRFVDRQGGKSTGTKGIREGFGRILGGNVMEGIKDINDSIMGSNKHQEAMDNVNKRIANAVKMRNNFEKGSEQWNKYNKQLEALNSDKLKFSYSSPKERDSLIASSSSFKNMDGASEGEMQAGNNLNANIMKAEEDRDRHKQGSAKWNAANEKVNALKDLRLQYIDTESHEQRASIIKGNRDAFTNLQSMERTQMEGKYNAWKMMEENAKTEDEKVHAHKMAKSYAGFIENYDNAKGSAGRDAAVKSLSDFESFNNNNPANLKFSTKEREDFGEICMSKNDNFINDYMNAKTHDERAGVLAEYNNYKSEHNGERPPVYNMPNATEKNYVNGMRNTAQQLMQRAASENYTPEQRGQMREIAGYYTAAADEFDAASTRGERLQVMNELNNHFSSIPADIRTAAGISAPAIELSEREAGFAAGLTPDQREAFTSIPTRRARCAFRDEYYRNSADFVPMDEAESAFYNSHFAEGHDDGYRNTASYRTQFLGSSTHEERQQWMEQYADYVSTAGNFDMPGNWTTSVGQSIASRCEVATGPASHTDVSSFSQTLTPAEMNDFSSLTNSRAQQDYMTLHYMASSAYIEPDADEEEFYNRNFDVEDSESYLNTPIYRTAFAAATSHEQRHQIMRDYSNYKYFADESQKPGNWSPDDSMQYYDSEESALSHMERSMSRVSSIISDVMNRDRDDTESTTHTERSSRDNFVSRRNTNGSNGGNNGGGGFS